MHFLERYDNVETGGTEMFFMDFDNNYREINEIAESLVSDKLTYTANMEAVRLFLKKEMEKQSLRSSDLAELTGWSPSKISKLLSGRQKFTDEDVRTWARALGYTPDPFVDSKGDIRYYKLNAYIRKFSDALKVYLDVSDKKPEHKAMAQYELPLSILTALKLKVSDYAVRADESYFGIIIRGTEIRFWQRTVSGDDEIIPEFGIFVSPEKDYFLFAVYIYTEQNEEMPELRMHYKEILQVEDKGLEKIKKFAKKEEWIPDYLKLGEIICYGYSVNDLPGSDELEGILKDIFQKYCALVWEIKEIDLLPERYKEPEKVSASQMYDMMTGNASFSAKVREEVLQRAQYKCENDPLHETFMDEHGNPYMEAVPLVPFSTAAQWGQQSVWSSDNGICLCPNCKAKMKYGTLNDREDMVIKLFRKHQKDLQNSGIKISLTQVLMENGLM